ncbi:hypothetical protein SAMN02799616_05012 [Paenibacillus sp. UNC499MF]|nr:hypothetical protein SAMN02799616_05012 [Paenibacillus sp. UNC499MF]
MRNWCYVLNQVHFETSSLQRTNCCFTAGTRAFNHDFNNFQTMFHSGSSCRFSSHLRSKRSAFTGSFEAQVTGTCPGKRVSMRIRDRYDCIVECGTDVCHTGFNIFTVTTFRTDDFFRFSHYSL